MRPFLILFLLLYSLSPLLSGNEYALNVSLSHSFCEETYDTLSVSVCETYTSPGGTVYTESGTYRDTLLNQAGCDSILTIHLTVYYNADITLQVEICSNTSYIFDGLELSESCVYRDTFISQYGCDSFVTLDLTVSDTLYYEFEKEVCSNTNYHFNGAELSQSGVYKDTLASQHGCDSIVTLKLSFQDTFYHEFDVEICENWDYVWNGVPLSQSGRYKDTLVSQHGCDSIVTLNLSVSEWVRGYTEVDICEGDSFTWNGEVFTKSAFEFRILVDSSGLGCDSIDVLFIKVHPNFEITYEVEICKGMTYPFNCEDLSAPGTYRAQYSTQYGCDSIVTLNLHLAPPVSQWIRVEKCFGNCYIFNDRAFCQPGTYTEFLTSPEGCDSIVVLDFAWVASYSDTTDVVLCEGEVFECNNEIFSGSGICQDSFIATGHCDSVIIYKIQESSIDTMIRQSGDTLFTLQEEAAAYQWMYCDSQEIAGATDSIFIPPYSGEYMVAITSQGCTDTSACIEILLTYTEEHPSRTPKEFRVYPNPSDHTVKFSADHFESGDTYRIIDIHGALIREGILSNPSLEIGDLVEGIYFLRINKSVVKFIKM